MKLLFCRQCQDVVSLRSSPRLCTCGNSGGQYVNHINAKYWGNDALLIGFNNGSFSIALHEQKNVGDREDSYGRRFEAFIIPTKAPSVKKVQIATDETIFHNDTLKWLLQAIFEAIAEANGTRSMAKEEWGAPGSIKAGEKRKVKGEVQSRVD